MKRIDDSSTSCVALLLHEFQGLKLHSCALREAEKQSLLSFIEPTTVVISKWMNRAKKMQSKFNSNERIAKYFLCKLQNNLKSFFCLLDRVKNATTDQQTVKSSSLIVTLLFLLRRSLIFSAAQFKSCLH
jgi:hypothetical protein